MRLGQSLARCLECLSHLKLQLRSVAEIVAKVLPVAVVRMVKLVVVQKYHVWQILVSFAQPTKFSLKVECLPMV